VLGATSSGRLRALDIVAMLTFNSRASSERVIELVDWAAGFKCPREIFSRGKVARKRMEQTKYYVKLYITPADEYQSKTSLNYPAFCVLVESYS
jgi:hypothetical protein